VCGTKTEKIKTK